MEEEREEKMEEEREENIWEMDISQPWFNFIIDEVKKREVRKNSKSWRKVKVGDLIDIHEKDKTEFYRYEVVSVIKYGTIEECLTIEGVENLLPGIKNFDEGLEIYLSFDGPDKRDQRQRDYNQDGVIAIELKRV